MEYAKALVTGGSGFIGSHLVDALIAQGIAVVVVDLVEPKEDRRNPSATYKIFDIRDTKMEELMLEVMPDVVFHLAAHIDDRASVLDPVMNAEHNILGTLQVLEAARKTGVKRFIFASTSVAYGNADVIPTPEYYASKPVTPYAISKLTCERYCFCYETIHGLSWMALRFANVYGPRQDGSKECGAIAIFTQKLLAAEPVILNNDGQTTRDYVYVSDVVRGCLAAASIRENGVVNLGTAQETMTEALLHRVEAAVGVTARVTYRPENLDVVKRGALATEKARKLLNWAPEVSLSEGITKTVAWYKARV